MCRRNAVFLVKNFGRIFGPYSRKHSNIDNRISRNQIDKVWFRKSPTVESTPGRHVRIASLLHQTSDNNKLAYFLSEWWWSKHVMCLLICNANAGSLSGKDNCIFMRVFSSPANKHNNVCAGMRRRHSKNCTAVWESPGDFRKRLPESFRGVSRRKISTTWTASVRSSIPCESLRINFRNIVVRFENCTAVYSIPCRNVRVYGGCLGFTKRWKTWNGCDKFRRGANQPSTRKCLNGETHCVPHSTNVSWSVPREVKHLSTWRNRKQIRELSFWSNSCTTFCFWESIIFRGRKRLF